MSHDLKRYRAQLPEHPPLETIFFGGGTPSLMSAKQIEAIVMGARATFGLSETAEITLEANPNDILNAKIEDWRTAGVNRLSIGVQSLDNAALKFLGRDHDAVSARRAIDLALDVFPSVSIDLIYARPDQKISDWQSELETALRLGAHHLSLYELTIEQRTAFGKAAARGELIPMPDDTQADFYELTQTITSAHGFPAYEVSNHAISEAHQSAHNMIYWRSGDWIGIGPGAHGRLTYCDERVSTEAVRRPDEYIAQLGPSEEKLNARDISREILTMGLRPVVGVELSRLPDLNMDALAELEALNLIAVTDGQLHTTTDGKLLTDAIAARLSP